MQRLADKGLDTELAALTQPVLGICLGMQLLFEHSAEGDTRTLGVIPGSVRRIAASADRPVPHMGWNRVHWNRGDPLFAGIAPDAYMYFVHSFAAEVSPATTACVDYGAPLSAAVQLRNFRGVQFHPERSAAAGARLLANFLELPSCC
jgi:glutamine amidotransferase